MAISTIKLASGKLLCSGLFWQPISGPSRNFTLEMAKLGKQLDCDLAVTLKGSALNQVGYASESDGAKEGLISVAALISKKIESLGESTFLCGIDLLDGRFLYVAQREGSILPDSDFIGTQDEVKSRMVEAFSLGTWSLVFSPDEWAISNSSERSFLSLVHEPKYFKYCRVSRINRNYKFIFNKILPLLILAGFLSYGASYGYNFYKEGLAKKTAADAALAKAMIVNKNPWEITPLAASFAASCLAEIDKYPLSPGGWTFSEAICNENGLTLTWTRLPYLTVGMIKAEVPQAVVDALGEKAVLQTPIKYHDGVKESLIKEFAAHDYIINKAQHLDLKVTLGALPAPALTDSGEASWHLLSWALTSSVSPVELGAWFDVPGFRIQTISLKTTDGSATWNMNGFQYVSN